MLLLQGLETQFESAFASLKEISPARDTVIWLGKRHGPKLTESKNTFSNAIEGVDITLNKAQKVVIAPLA